ncbi:MAG: helix-turn-helix domain-containing protein [Bacteroidales bacterium]|nr:helix-turn-helix domain-containing protein [Bacteroidales bacterium]MBN2819371.1 helix-turn-helix domain-containing protein [Bacteroidales bacterium]
MEEIYLLKGNEPDVPHRHEYYTILWAKKVCGLHYIDYVEYPIKPNYIFFVTPGQVHQVITFGEPEGYVIMFTPEFIHKNNIDESFLTNLGLFSDSAATPPLTIDSKAAEQLNKIVVEIQKHFHDNNAFREDLLGSYLKIFLVECNKHLPENNMINLQVYESGRNILKEFKTLVEIHYPKWHKVSEYAGEMNITPDYLNNVIKTTIGKTAKEFIQNRLILEAKRLGIHTQLSTKEIAFQIGFEDPSHFSKFFKSAEGQPFSEFKSSLEKSLI